MTASAHAASQLPPLWQAIEDLHERRDPNAFDRTWQLLYEQISHSCSVLVRKENAEYTIRMHYRATEMRNMFGELERVIELRWMP